VSVLVAEAGYSHAQLWTAAMRRWRRESRNVRRWWLDGQALDEVRAGNKVELLLRESAWPFPYFCGSATRARPVRAGALEILTGIDWQHRPVTFTRAAATLTGPHAALTADVRESAFEATPRD
jgi:hypothetical protein